VRIARLHSAMWVYLGLIFYHLIYRRAEQRNCSIEQDVGIENFTFPLFLSCEKSKKAYPVSSRAAIRW
jgi:hypothetical protein